MRASIVFLIIFAIVGVLIALLSYFLVYDKAPPVTKNSDVQARKDRQALGIFGMVVGGLMAVCLSLAAYVTY